MKYKTKYRLLALSIIVILLFGFNYFGMRYYFDYQTELIITGILIGIGALTFFIYKLKSDKALIKIMFAALFLSFLLNIHLSFEKFKIFQRHELISKYMELKTCKKQETRFLEDLKNGSIKYFTYNIAHNTERTELLKSKYQIENFFMGDLIINDMKCYNNLVKDYIEEKYNIKMNEIK